MPPGLRGKATIEASEAIAGRSDDSQPLLGAVDASLRDEANILRKWGVDGIADAIDRCREAYQAALQEYDQQLLSLAEAALYSGYSKDHLRRLARSGALSVTLRGRRLFFELHRLPRKPVPFDAPQLRQYDVAADARRVIDRRLRGGFHETQEITDREGQ
jgi:hypothetical protein